MLTELESPSWWPFSSKLWKTPSETKPKEGASTSSPKALGKEGVVVRIPAVISQRTASHVKPGSLTVLVSGLEIHDSSSMLMHRYEREDVDDIKVHTPYEISIRQRFIGKPDIAYHLISARMPEAIPVLEVQFSKKMEVLGDAPMPGSTRTSSAAERGSSVWHAGERPSAQPCTGLQNRCQTQHACGLPVTCGIAWSSCGFQAPATVHLFVGENNLGPLSLVPPP